MKFAYYPGCSAKSSCAELNEAMHNVAPKLDLQLLEIESATCTGAREIRAVDPIGFLALNVRILALAETMRRLQASGVAVKESLPGLADPTPPALPDPSRER